MAGGAVRINSIEVPESHAAGHAIQEGGFNANVAIPRIGMINMQFPALNLLRFLGHSIERINVLLNLSKRFGQSVDFLLGHGDGRRMTPGDLD